MTWVDLVVMKRVSGITKVSDELFSQSVFPGLEVDFNEKTVHVLWN